ncbi:MAG: hypothetical protein RLZZ385_1987 [Pseudomonadota bacterium]|jgi:thiamine biosynthesis lipoprotein
MIEHLRRHAFSIAFVGVLFAFFFIRPLNDSELLQLSGYTMGTSYRLQLVELPRGVTREQLQQQVAELLERLDRQVFSTYAEQSELSRFNGAPVATPVRVSPELLDVMQLARQISELTNGAFDVTVGPLVNLWGFGPGPNAGSDVIPDGAAIEAALAEVGYRHLAIDAAAGTVTKLAPVTVDLSAIAKGYVVDEVAGLFDALGIADYFLEIGGELKIRGRKPGDASWVPAIERPVDAAPEVYQALYTKGETVALAGSGDYRNYFERDGVRYSHEIDPRTGRPITHNLAAVYVLDASTARADALATAFMVLGYEQGRQLADSQGLAVYFIYRGNDGVFGDYFTPRFAPYLNAEE